MRKKQNTAASSINKQYVFGPPLEVQAAWTDKQLLEYQVNRDLDSAALEDNVWWKEFYLTRVEMLMEALHETV